MVDLGFKPGYFIFLTTYSITEALQKNRNSAVLKGKAEKRRENMMFIW